MRHHRQKVRLGLIGELGPLARGDQILFDADALGNVVEPKNTADDPLLEILRQRFALEEAAIEEVQEIVGFGAIDDFAQAGTYKFALDDRVGDKVEDRLVLLTQQQFFGALATWR